MSPKRTAHLLCQQKHNVIFWVAGRGKCLLLSERSERKGFTLTSPSEQSIMLTHFWWLSVSCIWCVPFQCKKKTKKHTRWKTCHNPWKMVRTQKRVYPPPPRSHMHAQHIRRWSAVSQPSDQKEIAVCFGNPDGKEDALNRVLNSIRHIHLRKVNGYHLRVGLHRFFKLATGCIKNLRRLR